MIIVQTPLRISFLGGGTDFEDFYKEYSGAVLSTAIDKYVFVIVKERFDDKIYINYSKKEIIDRRIDIKHGLVREAMRYTGVARGIEITMLSDIPSEGTGLGSSSSIIVGLLHALYIYQGRLVTEEQLAQQACEIEIDILGKPIGKQDQYIAAYGGMRFITFGRDIKVEDVDIDKRSLEEHLLLLFTGITRQADSILKEQRNGISLNISKLRMMMGGAYQGKEALEKRELDRFGKLLHHGWMEKRELAPHITNSNIDGIYRSALEAGAIGGKVLGAGGGGFILLYCPIEKKRAIREKLGLRELPFHFEPDGSKVIFNYRRPS